MNQMNMFTRRLFVGAKAASPWVKMLAAGAGVATAYTLANSVEAKEEKSYIYVCSLQHGQLEMLTSLFAGVNR